MRYATLCSGIEACSAAWHPLGMEPVFYSEIEPFSKAVLKQHYPNTPDLGDMTQFNQWKDYGPIDLICAGTPCQAFSVAGLREGLRDPRGNLTLVFLGVLEKYRPKWVVWENVPGVLSDKSNAFGQFIAGLSELGYGVSWRVLDAQYFGVAQRRKRVFVVGCLGDWRASAAVLLDPHSLSGDIAPSRKQGERTAGSTTESIGGGWPAEVASTLDANFGSKQGQNNQHVNGVAQPIPIDMRNAGRDADKHDEMNRQGVGVGNEGDPAHTVTSAYVHAVATNMAIRRITPTEAERLQGFPDGYTDIPWSKKDHSPDGARYKALGNSMAVPVMRWIGIRIMEVNEVLK